MDTPSTQTQRQRKEGMYSPQAWHHQISFKMKINDFSVPKLVTRHSTQHSAGQQQREVVEVLKYIHYNLSLFDGGTMGWISVESVVDYGVVGDNASCKHPLQLWSGAAKWDHATMCNNHKQITPTCRMNHDPQQIDGKKNTHTKEKSPKKAPQWWGKRCIQIFDPIYPHTLGRRVGKKSLENLSLWNFAEKVAFPRWCRKWQRR